MTDSLCGLLAQPPCAIGGPMSSGRKSRSQPTFWRTGGARVAHCARRTPRWTPHGRRMHVKDRGELSSPKCGPLADADGCWSHPTRRRKSKFARNDDHATAPRGALGEEVVLQLPWIARPNMHAYICMHKCTGSGTASATAQTSEVRAQSALLTGLPAAGAAKL